MGGVVCERAKFVCECAKVVCERAKFVCERAKVVFRKERVHFVCVFLCVYNYIIRIQPNIPEDGHTDARNM